MRQRLIQYVDLLFAGAADAEDIKQEILQNTLDRYDDLVSQGKSEEAAYRLAISGIGDINEILTPMKEPAPQITPTAAQQEEPSSPQARKMRAVAIAMYICSPIPLFLLGHLGTGVIGLCMTILLVAAATYVLLLSRKSGPRQRFQETKDPRKKLVSRIVDTTALIIYLLMSFSTQAWAITWLIFPIAGCVEGLINAIIDLKEACQNEN